MVILVDAYNIIKTHGGSFPGDLLAQRKKLLGLCSRYAAATRGIEKMVVVFDGKDGVYPWAQEGAAGAKVQAIFSSGGKDADQEILRWIERNGPREVHLATDDGALRAEARALGCQAMSSTTLMKRVQPSSGPKAVRGRARDKSMSADAEDRLFQELKKKWGDK